MLSHPGFERQRTIGVLGEGYADDPAYATWSADGHAAETMTFDEWLDTPDGRAWLDREDERYSNDASFNCCPLHTSSN